MRKPPNFKAVKTKFCVFFIFFECAPIKIVVQCYNFWSAPEKNIPKVGIFIAWPLLLVGGKTLDELGKDGVWGEHTGVARHEQLLASTGHGDIQFAVYHLAT